MNVRTSGASRSRAVRRPIVVVAHRHRSVLTGSAKRRAISLGESTSFTWECVDPYCTLRAENSHKRANSGLPITRRHGLGY